MLPKLCCFKSVERQPTVFEFKKMGEKMPLESAMVVSIALLTVTGGVAVS